MHFLANFFFAFFDLSSRTDSVCFYFLIEGPKIINFEISKTAERRQTLFAWHYNGELENQLLSFATERTRLESEKNILSHTVLNTNY